MTNALPTSRALTRSATLPAAPIGGYDPDAPPDLDEPPDIEHWPDEWSVA